MIEAKDRGDGSRRTLFTVEHFKEMIELENFILSLTAPEDLVDKIKPESVSFYDLCRKTDITDEVVVKFAENGCEIDEYYCIPDIPQKCEAT